MKSSNLAERVDFEEVDVAAVPAPEMSPQAAPRPAPAPRPRRSLESRSIVIREQGFVPFRVF